MDIAIIYHSETGNTRRVAKRMANEFGGSLIGVTDLAHYSRIGMYLKGSSKAMKGEHAEIDPPEIDVSGADLVVIGSPVWARHPTPAINAVIAALRGCEGKHGIVFATSGGMPGNTLELMTSRLEERGVAVVGAHHIPQGKIGSEEAFAPLRDMVQSVLQDS